ncbi:MAG: protein kinase [Deltaproteobacteria bacterium]|nr:protein kinase [Deltaproteobacteria bacterium]
MNLPQSFGKYELIEHIATGGMAEVFLARATGMAGFEKQLVIKRILPELALDPRFVQMFIAEANIAVQLNHPNVVQVFDLDRVKQTWFIAMEHLHGQDLTRLVKALRARGERLDIPVSAVIVAEVLRGLDYAHGRVDDQGRGMGLVHRDVSPHNVVVTFTGEVKLVDFGIARLMNGGTELEAELPRGGAGKFAYMAPEQALGEPGDHRVDVFAAGIVLWELIANRRLYLHPDPEEKLRLVREARIPPLGAALDGLPAGAGPELEAILAMALAREVEQRYASAALFEEDLRAWLHRHGFHVGRSSIAAELLRVFPDKAQERARGFDVGRLLADVERLDPEPRDGTPTASEPSGPLSGARGERKTVVVVAVDLSGLTEASAMLEPDLFVQRRLTVLRWLHKVVERYGGKMQHYVDEQVLVFFGVPRTQLDDAERAVSCALELHEAVAALRPKDIRLQLTIGVHVGEVTIGPVRPQLRYLSRGDTTRLPRRLSQLAEFGQVLVSQRMLPLVERRFRVVRGPDLAGRGTSLPLPTYWVRARRGSLVSTGQGAWIRRGQELEVVREALLPLSTGRGTALLLSGGTGVGKSRLLQEILGLARRRGMMAYVARCAVWGEEVPLEPLRELLRQVLGLRHKADPEDVQTKVGRLYNLGISEEVRQVLASLLGDTPPETGAVWRAFQVLLHGLAEERPLIVALDDVQRLGEAEHRLLLRLVEESVGHPILFLLTWKGAPSPLLSEGLIQVSLGPFDRANQLRLVRSLLQVDEVDQEICALVERTCEGNPLYIEEMLKYLVHEEKIGINGRRAEASGGIRSAALPRTLAAVFAARIDALDLAAKGTLQLASLVGSTFSASLVSAAAGVDDPVPLMSALASHGLIRRVPGEDPDAWAFSSDLVREAASRGILGVQRRDFHRLIAAALEEQEGERQASAMVVAEHCARGGRLLDAARYAYRAGQALEEGQFLERAQEVYGKGIQWMAEVERTTENWDLRVQGEALLYHRYGAVSLLRSEVGRGERALVLALDIAAEFNLSWIEAAVHLELGKSYLHRRRFSLASVHLEQAQLLVAGEPDAALELEVREASALAAQEAREERAASLWEEARVLASAQGPAAEARCMLGLAAAHKLDGLVDEPIALLQEALEKSRAGGDRILEGRILNNLGLLYSSREAYDEALRCFRRALAVREGVGYARGVVINHHNIGDVHLRRGHYHRAYVAFERSREVARELQWDRPVLVNSLYLNFLDAVMGEDAARARLDEGVEAARLLGDSETVASGMELQARFLAATGQTKAAGDLFDQAIAAAREARLLGTANHLVTLRAKLLSPL